MLYDGLIIGQKLRSLRLKRKLSIEELSDRLGMSASHINQIELGSRRMSMDLLYKIMDELDEDANTILGIQKKSDDSYLFVNELMELSKEQREYIINVFHFMICNFKDKQTLI